MRYKDILSIQTLVSIYEIDETRNLIITQARYQVRYYLSGLKRRNEKWQSGVIQIEDYNVDDSYSL